MAKIAKKINLQKGFDFDEKPKQSQVSQSNPDSFGQLFDTEIEKKEPLPRKVIKTGLKPLDEALKQGGIEVGRVCNIEVFDRVFNPFAALLAVSLAENDKKIGLSIPPEVLKTFFPYWKNLWQKSPPEIQQKSRDFLNVTCDVPGVQNVFWKAKKMGVELLVIFDPWTQFTTMRRAAEIATESEQNKIATITISALEYPSWNTKRRQKFPCLQTLMESNQCNIMVAPNSDKRKGAYRNTYINDSFLKKIREKISDKCSVPFVLELITPLKSGESNKKKVFCHFSRRQPLGFTFD